MAMREVGHFGSQGGNFPEIEIPARRLSESSIAFASSVGEK